MEARTVFMERSGTRGRNRLILLRLSLLMGLFFSQAKCQPGFLNIDCGSDESYEDSRGTYWETDAKYVSTGANHKNITPAPTSLYALAGYNRQVTSLRFFADPKYNRDCYTLPTKPATTYLVSTVFYAGDFLRNNETVSFSVYLNGSIWLYDYELSYGPPYYRSTHVLYWPEAVVYSNGSTLNLCLVRKSGPSLISAIQLREAPTNGTMHSIAKKRHLRTLSRIAFMGSPDFLRYPHDIYDRMFISSSISYEIHENLTYIQNTTSIGPSDNRLAPDAPIPGVLQNAAVDYGNHSQGISYLYQNGDSDPPLGDTILTAYFLELDHNASSTEVRGISYTVNGQYVGTVNTSSKAGQVTEMSMEITVEENYLQVVFERAPWSKLPAIINALEAFGVRDYDASRTEDTDLAAINVLRRKLNLTDWTGDPCIPVPFLWVECTADNIDSTVFRVTSVMLSDMGMSGSLPNEILQLQKLSNLSLSNNNLTGSIPDLKHLQQLQFLSLSNNSFTGFMPDLNSLKYLEVLSLHNNRLTGPIPNLSNLVHLQTLTLQNNLLNGSLPSYLAGFPNFTDFQVDYNNFSGTIPSELIDKQNSGLHFTYTNNRDLHRKKRSSVSSKIGLIVGIAAAVVAFLIIFSVTVWHLSTRKLRARKRILKKMGINRQLSGILSKSEKSRKRCQDRQPCRSGQVVLLSLEDVYKATKKFARKIGQGSFGPVYHGILPSGKEVAVKVNSGFIQGLDEFLNEVDLLSRIHHRNLVSLVGYCDEAQQEILIYTFLPNGSVCDHLYGNRSHEPLDWKRRLNIALNSATGLEYLHVSCNPRIIHRDIKSSNILLDENWVAKVADFGISRQFETIAGTGSCITGVETLLKGTPGYIDPDYLDSHRLTQKSDVYSFGVVLLEIISGHHPHVAVLPDGTARTLVQWAHASVKANNPLEIFDPILRGEFSHDAAIRVLTLAIRCTSRETAERPNMGEVVRDIMEAIKADSSCKRVVGEDATLRVPRRTYGQVRHSEEEVSEEPLTDLENDSKRITRSLAELENNSQRMTGIITEMENRSNRVMEEGGNLNPPQADVTNFSRGDPTSVLDNRHTPGDHSKLQTPLGTGDESYFKVLPR